MENLEIYNKVRQVPKDAQKPINAGRLKGMTDINPQWRIEKLTEVFGVCGVGWYAKITDKRFETGANDEVVCFVDIDLFVKVDGEWSKPIAGTGGSTFVAKESKGLYTSDEVIKMAFTDAISVACKQLGFGADIYWNKSDSKYQKNTETTAPPKKNVVTQPKKDNPITKEQIKKIHTLIGDREELKSAIYKKFGVESSKELTEVKALQMIKTLEEGNKKKNV